LLILWIKELPEYRYQ